MSTTVQAGRRPGTPRHGRSDWRLRTQRLAVFVHDLVWIPLSLALAFLLRFGVYHPRLIAEVRALAAFAVIAVIAHSSALWWRGCYRGMWRFASLPDLVRLTQAVGVGMLLTLAGAFLSGRLNGFPRSILLIYPVILLIGLGSGRLIYRIWKDRGFVWGLKGGPRAVIVGAGRAGELLIRDLRRHQSYVPVALLDDSGRKRGREIHGVRVRGTLNDLESMLQRTGAEVVLFAIPTAPKQKLQRVVEICKERGIPCRTLPSIAELANGKVSVESLRPVSVEDLLGRDPVRLGSTRVKKWLHGRRVLVTGGGGSIGAELCRQALRGGAASVCILDNSEYNLYRIVTELEETGQGEVVSSMTDVTDPDEVKRTFASFRPHYVFHAAAYKHVPLVELNPLAGIRVNILGTKVVAETAAKFHAQRFVLVSTDKAVAPTSVMGATKRIAELLCKSMNGLGVCSFVVTRFGNVLGSTGSVVPRFREQIKRGGPVTVTHPEIRRYFMTVQEAVSLILEAGASEIDHGVFVLDMGQLVYIRELAEQMIYLSGFEPDRDIKINYVGLRPGEKLYEELFYPEERHVGTGHPKLILAQSPEFMERDALAAYIGQLAGALKDNDASSATTILRELVPSFQPQHLGYETKSSSINVLPLRGGA